MIDELISPALPWTWANPNTPMKPTHCCGKTDIPRPIWEDLFFKHEGDRAMRLAKVGLCVCNVLNIKKENFFTSQNMDHGPCLRLDYTTTYQPNTYDELGRPSGIHELV